MSVHPSVLHLSIRLSVRIEKIGSNWTDFRETLLGTFITGFGENLLDWTNESNILGQRGQRED